MEITDEMRRAVYLEMCQTVGHLWSINTFLKSSGPDDNLDVRGPAEGIQPHTECGRCHKTYLLINEPGVSYEDAEDKLLNKLKETDGLAAKIKAMRDKRKGPKK